MAVRRKARRATVRRTAVRARATRALRRVQDELPPTLAEFSREVRRGLLDLEKSVVKAAAPVRRELARVLREGSHLLGRFEAEGERRFRKLSGRARSEALTVLRRLERAVQGLEKSVQGGARKSTSGLRKTARRRVRRRAAA